MTKEPTTSKDTADKVVKNIRRKTRQTYLTRFLSCAGKGSHPLLLEPDVWIGKVNIDALGAMRGKQAEIHRGSRLRYIGPPKEAGYTSAIATSRPEPHRPLQLGGVHIHPHMASIIHDAATQHSAGKAPWFSNGKWPKRHRRRH